MDEKLAEMEKFLTMTADQDNETRLKLMFAALTVEEIKKINAALAVFA